MVYLELFWSFFQVGLFSFGGGYAALPLIEEQIINVKGWMDQIEFSNMLTLSQLTPGPIALNTSTFVGMKVGGVFGGIVATLGCILPSLLICLLLAFVYFKYSELLGVKGIISGLKPAVIGLILSAGLSITMLSIFNAELNIQLNKIDYIALGLFIPSFIILLKYKINPVIIMLINGFVGGILYLLL